MDMEAKQSKDAAQFTAGPLYVGPATLYRGDIGQAYEVTAGGAATWDPHDPDGEGMLGNWQYPDGYKRLATTSDMGPEAKANALLWAAAPQLYAALDALIRFQDTDSMFRLPVNRPEIAAARAALALARAPSARGEGR
jgi:hypothetical protein